MTTNDTTTQTPAADVTAVAEAQAAAAEALVAAQDETLARVETADAIVTPITKPRRGSRASRATAKTEADAAAAEAAAMMPDAADEPKADEPKADEPASTTSTRAPRKPAEPKADAKFRGVEVDHYSIVKTTPGFDQLMGDGADETAPKWLTRCNLHGKTAKADNRKAGRGLGSAEQRATWCSGCKSAAAKVAAAAK